MSRQKIVLVGGGSLGWAPGLVKDIVLTESLSDSEIILYDINKKASNLTKRFIERLFADERFKQKGAKIKLVSTDNQAVALRNADYVIITITTGGLKAIAPDLAIPQKYGIYHAVGDTSGPGSWGRVIRNYPAFMDLAKAINRYAPGAMVINYTNPMTTLTDILSRTCDGPVVGLCHALFSNINFIKDLYKLDGEEEISMKYAGLNHFFWITEAYACNIDVIADLKKKLKNNTFDDLVAKLKKAGKGKDLPDSYRIATELFRFTGVMPYIGDRHTCEFFPHYITSRANMKKYDVEQWFRHISMDARVKRTKENRKKLCKMLSTRIDDRYFIPSRESAANIIEAHSTGKVFIDVGNLPNTGQVSNVPLGAVLETAVMIDRNGFTPVNFGAIPEPVLGLIEPWSKVFTMIVDACFRQDKDLALYALRLDPLCSHLTTGEVVEMGEKILTANRKYTKGLF
ncbi:MAG: hypothetical protein ABIG61_16565 [Planctomycetota bacterium]